MNDWISQQVQYPEYEKQKSISGTVYINFIVEEDGKITNPRILRGVGDAAGLEKEAVRWVQSMPYWIPGKQNGKAVKVQCTLPVKFALTAVPVMRDFILDKDICFKGAHDADLYHGKTGAHIVLGALFGPFAVIGAAVANPVPHKGKNTYILSSHKDLFSDPSFIKCYKRKAKTKNVINTVIGWGGFIIVFAMLSGMR